MAAKDSIVGPFGGQGGKSWFYVPKGPITWIYITYGDIINTIRFEHINESGSTVLSDLFGSRMGQKNAEIVIDPKAEKLSGIDVTFGDYAGMQLVTTLSLTTNVKTYGAFGTPTGTTAVSCQVKDDENIIGFHGRGGFYIDSIAVVVKPNE